MTQLFIYLFKRNPFLVLNVFIGFCVYNRPKRMLWSHDSPISLVASLHRYVGTFRRAPRVMVRLAL
jgi:hypothetical protein